MSQVLKEVLGANEKYSSSFTKGDLTMPPARRFAILTCMDARLDPAKFAGLSEGDAQLSLPAVVQGMDYAVRVPGSHQVGRYEFACEGEPLVVTILQADQRTPQSQTKGQAA